MNTLLLLAIAVPAPFGEMHARPERPAVLESPRERGSTVQAKVLSVEQHAAYAVRIGVGSDDGLRKGCRVAVGTLVDRKWTGAASGYVVQADANESECTVFVSRKGRAPRVGDDVLITRITRDVPLVVGKQAIFLDGELADWDQVFKKLEAIAATEEINLAFRMTFEGRGELPRHPEKQRRVREWAAALKISYSVGYIDPSVSKFYNSIASQADLESDSYTRTDGAVTANGKLVSGAEVVVIPQHGSNYHYEVYLSQGRIRDPWSHPHRTITRNGRFTLYSPEPDFQILVLHESGFAMMSRVDVARKVRIRLKPWASVSGRFESPEQFRQETHFTTRWKPEGRAQVNLEVWQTPQHADGRFHEPHMPPGTVVLGRSVRAPRGGSTSFETGIVELKPGANHNVVFKPLAGKQLQRANEHLEGERR